MWSPDSENEVRGVVHSLGSKVVFIVGFGGRRSVMGNTWLKAAGEEDISYFVVKSGRILWIGPERDVDRSLKEISSGKFYFTKHKAEFDKNRAADREDLVRRKSFENCRLLFNAGKTAEAKRQLETFRRKYPRDHYEVDLLSDEWLAREDRSAYQMKAAVWLKSKDALVFPRLTVLAQTLFKSNRTLSFRIVEFALKSTEEKDKEVLATALNIFLRSGDDKRALHIVNKCLEVFPKSNNKFDQFNTENLQRMRQELEAKLRM